MAEAAGLEVRQIMDTPQRFHLLCTLAAAVAAQVDIAATGVLAETINQRELRRREQAERLALAERLVAVAEGREFTAQPYMKTFMDQSAAGLVAVRALKEPALPVVVALAASTTI
jgi:hypothetical protein